MRAALIWTLAALASSQVPAFSQEPGQGAAPEARPGIEGQAPLPPPAADAPPASRAGTSQAEPGAAAAQAAASPAERLDGLFADLKRESDATAAAAISARIEQQWASSGSDTVDLLVQWAGEAMARSDKAAALDLLGEAIVMKPDYAESWNRRATLHFLDNDYGKSIYDIEQTLSLEPRHYGALMGLGGILEETSRKPQALEAYTRALAVYPALKSAQDAVARLSEELAGQAI